MSILAKPARLFGWAVVVLLLAAMLAACGDDDDDEDPTATSTAAGGEQAVTATSAPPDPTATSASTDSTEAATEDEDEPAGATATSTEPEASPTEAETEEADATATPGDSADATATSSDGADATSEESELPEVPELDELTTVLENFTFRMQGVLTADPELGPQEIVVDIQQSAPDNYYLKTEIAGEVLSEIWLIGTTAYIQIPGAGVQELPNADPAMLSAFSPALFMQPIQDNQGLQYAEEIGQETINGRETTHYSVDAEAYAQSMEAAGETVTNVTGEGGEMWVDNELNILIRAEIDIAFTDQDGADFQTQATWEVTEIGTTAEVTPPQ